MQECYQHKQYSLIKKIIHLNEHRCTVYYLENPYILALTKLLLCILKKSKVYTGQTKAVQYNCQHSQVFSPLLILHLKWRLRCKNYRAIEPQSSSSDTTQDTFFKRDSTEWQHKIGKRDMIASEFEVSNWWQVWQLYIFNSLWQIHFLNCRNSTGRSCW